MIQGRPPAAACPGAQGSGVPEAHKPAGRHGAGGAGTTGGRRRAEQGGAKWRGVAREWRGVGRGRRKNGTRVAPGGTGRAKGVTQAWRKSGARMARGLRELAQEWCDLQEKALLFCQVSWLLRSLRCPLTQRSPLGSGSRRMEVMENLKTSHSDPL